VANIRFEWDESKNESNLRKHDVSFEDAIRVFLDPLRVMRLERIVNGEERWQTIGAFEGIVLLIVAHTVWDESSDDGLVEVIRIISARRVTRREQKSYGQDREIYP
jgi:uncharacterized DUF497 family protein